jgi:hypothetical protein
VGGGVALANLSMFNSHTLAPSLKVVERVRGLPVKGDGLKSFGS